MKWYAAYDPATGRIIQTGAVRNADASLPQGPPGAALYQGQADHVLHYIDPQTKQRVDRMAMTHTLVTETGKATLTDLPDPCKVGVQGEVHDVSGGSAVLEFDAPGTYSVGLTSEPRYLPETLKIDVP